MQNFFKNLIELLNSNDNKGNVYQIENFVTNVAGVLLLGRNHMHASHIVKWFFFVHCKKILENSLT